MKNLQKEVDFFLFYQYLFIIYIAGNIFVHTICADVIRYKYLSFELFSGEEVAFLQFFIIFALEKCEKPYKKLKYGRYF